MTSNERRSFGFHLSYSFLDGVILGAIALYEFVFLEINGSEYQMTLLFTFKTGVLTFSVLFNEILRKSLRKKRLLRSASIVSRLPLVLFLFFPESIASMAENSLFHYLYLIIFLFFFIADPLILPSVNLLLKQNYAHERFSKLYSYTTVVSRITTFFITFLLGIIFDADVVNYRYAFPLIGLCGILSVFLLTAIPFKEPLAVSAKTKGIQNAVKNSLRGMWEIFKQNKAYRDFEIGFMFYGFAFMVSYPVIKVFMDSELHLNFSSISLYLNLGVFGSIILLPVFGRILGTIDPRKFAIFTFGSLMMYILFVMLTIYYSSEVSFLDYQIYYTLLIAFVFYAVFAATMGLLWWIGSAYFCANDDAGTYQSIHITLTGLRGLLFPLIGTWIFDVFGYYSTFIVAILMLLFGIAYIWHSYKKHHLSAN